MEPPADAVEILRPDLPRGGYRAVLFDFDGTLSLIRRNWQDVMIPMMVDVLQETGSGEPRDELYAHVEDFVMRLNGRQTIYQMMQLAEEVAQRGGTPLEPLSYKHRYHELLWVEVSQRVSALEEGRAAPDDWTVPDARRLLEQLRARGLPLYLASGTDVKYVRDELAVLGLAEFFGPHVYGALDDYKRFSKGLIIQQIIDQTGVPGEAILGFGDGFVEIEEIRRVGGTAIGVASNEETRQGINAWKRNRLVQAGADVIIGDYRCQDGLFAMLGL
jgi:phosphoglycolate phosphatase-like HAD superfamily hydrolase